MPRNARAVAIGYPHHITQRGNNCAPVFFDDQDRQTYTDLLKRFTRKFNVDIWAYCLMPNHVHLLVVPQMPDALSLGVGRTNQVYTTYINRKYIRSGRLWQNRFYSSIVDGDDYLWAVARYIENNPVKAGLVSSAVDYPWSSAKHHLVGVIDSLLSGMDWLREETRKDYRQFLLEKDEQLTNKITQATRGGRPLCNIANVSKLEKLLGRTL